MSTNSKIYLAFGICIAALGIGLIVTLMVLRGVQRDLAVAESNLRASQDTLREYKISNGDLLWARTLWISERAALRDSLEKIGVDMKELEKILDDKIELISFLEGQVRIDTVIRVRDSIVYVDSTGDPYKYFNVRSEYYSIYGYHHKGYTTIETVNIPLDLRVGLTKGRQIWVHSSNPFVHITSITGASVSDEDLARVRKPWISHGLQIGFGCQWGMINRKLDVGPYIGYGVTINF